MRPVAAKSSIGYTISALSYEGLSAFTHDGKPARVAIIDEAGRVIDSGKKVADAVFHISVEAYRKFLIDEGHMRLYTEAEALAMQLDAADRVDPAEAR